MKLLLATSSEHKRDEIAAMLCGVPHLELLTLREVPIEMPEETGTTMRANARLKAEAGARTSGLICLADDSGIEVDALDGAPGVRSARWVEGSDEDRVHALLRRMEGVPDSARTARYRCALCLTWPLDALLSYEGDLHREEVEGTCEGRIGRELRGSNGFGYDPIFELTDQSGCPAPFVRQTMAEAPPDLKAQISHRARAVAALLPILLGFAGHSDSIEL